VEFGFEKMTLKDETVRCYFINRPDSPYFETKIFKNILDFLQTGTNKARLKQTGKLFLLVVDAVKNMNQLYTFLRQMHNQVVKKEETAEVTY
jgi:transcription-repair coupling factor (superfamily II helicase)